MIEKVSEEVAPKHKKQLLISTICYTNLQLTNKWESPKASRLQHRWCTVMYAKSSRTSRMLLIKRENMVLEKSTRNRLEFATRGHEENANTPSVISCVSSAPVYPRKSKMDEAQKVCQ